VASHEAGKPALFTFQSPRTRVFLVDWDRQKMTFTAAGSLDVGQAP